ncbi:uncharacterized protein BP01DRAFT_423284 [Aspergillus saccharolyticus JOP 1030-1]|uniref:Uncharacterized protein n=1 Tax=Aspergillus saccharolyticus JOP 1030-1 TaxID=1450539 RepID=A0A318ZDQ2_9EURO|nr:hypothetical protein BP01DRAFT_423284 [Aspergillus saccharolyticus JOP 1030-1]PYH45489.1 hypothetical protein BP01DRAFT_423284 [Aspergillus saccharolyticus JOP 1030-1]
MASQPACLETLPNELLDEIVSYLLVVTPSEINFHHQPALNVTSSSTPNLKNVAQVSSRLLEIVRPRLYGHCRLNDDELDDFLNFVASHELERHITSLVVMLGNGSLRDLDTNQLLRSLSNLNPLRIAVLAPPSRIGAMLSTKIPEEHSWAFQIAHQLWQWERTTPHGSSISTTSPLSTSLDITNYSSLRFNEGSSLRAYAHYEYFLFEVPSVLGRWGTIARMGAEEEKIAISRELQHLTSFSYTAIFPFYNHVKLVLDALDLMPNLKSLTVQLAPCSDDTAIDLTNRGPIDPNDPWMELATAYDIIAHSIVELGRSASLVHFRTLDYQNDALRVELYQAMGITFQDTEWVPNGRGEWNKMASNGELSQVTCPAIISIPSALSLAAKLITHFTPSIVSFLAMPAMVLVLSFSRLIYASGSILSLHCLHRHLKSLGTMHLTFSRPIIYSAVPLFVQDAIDASRRYRSLETAMDSFDKTYAADPVSPILAHTLLSSDRVINSSQGPEDDIDSSHSTHTAESWSLEADLNAGLHASPNCIFRAGAVIGFSRLRTKSNDDADDEYIGQLPRTLLTNHLVHQAKQLNNPNPTTVFIVHPATFNAFSPRRLLTSLLNNNSNSSSSSSSSSTATADPTPIPRKESLTRDEALACLDRVQIFPVFDLNAALQAIHEITASITDTHHGSLAQSQPLIILVAGLDTLAEGVVRTSNAVRGAAVLTTALRTLTQLTRTNPALVSVLLVNTSGLGTASAKASYASGPAAPRPHGEVNGQGQKEEGGVRSAFAENGTSLFSSLLMRTLDQAVDTHLLVSTVAKRAYETPYDYDKENGYY